MKKIVLFLFLGLFLISGCGKKDDQYQTILKDYSKSYYETYMMGVDNQNQVEITLDMLAKANEYGADYDLSKLAKCQKDTLVILTLNNDKEITNYEYELKCN